jgi:hypothetical protein
VQQEARHFTARKFIRLSTIHLPKMQIPVLTLLSTLFTLPVSASTQNKASLDTRHPKSSAIEFFTYDGFGQYQRDNLWYTQAARVGDRIEISGQGKFPS